MLNVVLHKWFFTFLRSVAQISNNCNMIMQFNSFKNKQLVKGINFQTYQQWNNQAQNYNFFLKECIEN